MLFQSSGNQVSDAIPGRVTHPSNFLAHHLARIVTAAVYSDAEHVVDGIVGLKQRAHDLARTGDPDDPAA